MNEQPEAPPAAVPAPASSSDGSPGGVRRLLLQAAPFVLLLGAALLYLRDIRAARQRTLAARAVRREASLPAADVVILHRTEEREMPFVVRCPPNVASNLLVALSHAEPVKFPRGGVEGEEFEIRLVRTNATVSVLRAVRLEGDPGTLFVGTKTQSAPSEEGTPGAWTVSRPARVQKAGLLFGAILEGIHKASDKLPPEEELRRTILSNAAQRAQSPAGTNAAPAPSGAPLQE